MDTTTDSVLGEVVMVKSDPGLDWPELGTIEMPDSAISYNPPYGYENGSKFSFPPPSAAAIAAAEATEVKGNESVKKRKAEKLQQNSKVAAEEELSKRSKANSEDSDSKSTDQNTNKTTSSNKNKKETSADTSKGNSKVSDVEKPDYIHVRARRGQATDSHSLAERVRREKISERMRYLQELVPGCNKITGKAGMLDEIINYVQSLQRQVEFLSMKLATVNPRTDFNIDSLFTKEVFPVGTSNLSAIMSAEMTNPAYVQFNPAPEAFIDSSCISQFQPSATWDAAATELQNLYSMAFTGCIQPSNQNMEI